MAHQPCEQEAAIGRLEATTEQIGKTLERLSKVLEDIASQGTRIRHLEDGQDVLFDRMRDIELKSESEKVKVGFIMTIISAVVSGVVGFFFAHGGHK